MFSPTVPLRRLRRLLPAACIFFVLACSGAPQPATPAAPETAPDADAAAAPDAEAAEAEGSPTEAEAEPAATAAEPAEPAAAPSDTLEPPDGEWLVDEEGRRYFIDKVAKVEGQYTRLEEDVVRVRNVMPLRIDHEDDDWFYFRVYDVSAVPSTPSKGTPSEAELAELDASFAAEELTRVDRLRAEPFDRGLPAHGQWRHGFDVADMDGDGQLDVVHGPARKGEPLPTVFLGDGAGGWRVWQVEYPPLSYDYGDAAAADFDGDGRNDIALAMHLTGIAVLVRDGDGGFRRWSDLPLRGEQQEGEEVFTSRTLVDADWNGDGRPDLLALAEGPMRSQSVSRDNPPLENVDVSGAVALIVGDDGFERKLSSGPDEGFGQEIAVADFDGDGRLDFATATSLLGFDQILKIGQPDGTWLPTAVEELRDRALIWSLAAADFDGDGAADLAVTYFSSRGGRTYEGIDVLYNRLAAGGGWERRALVSEQVEAVLDGSYARYTALGAGDVDGDGHSDLAALTADGAVHLFLGRAGGGFVFEESPELGSEGAPQRGCHGYHVRLVDLDGDGRDEIVAGFAGEPGSEQLTLRAGDAASCRSRGALRAWDLQAAP